MNEDEKLVDSFIHALQLLLKNATRPSILIVGEIISVDETTYTANVVVNGITFYEVPLKVLKGSQASFMEIPKVNTKCTLRFRDNSIQQPQLVDIHECSKILVKIGASTLEVIDGTWTFNGGENGGLAIVKKLVTQYNAIENDLNDLKDIFSNWVVVPNDGGGALKTASGIWASQSLVLTEDDDIENTKILQ